MGRGRPLVGALAALAVALAGCAGAPEPEPEPLSEIPPDAGQDAIADAERDLARLRAEIVGLRAEDEAFRRGIEAELDRLERTIAAGSGN